MATNTPQAPYSDLPIAPGDLLGEELEFLSMSQQQLAIRTGRPVQVVNEIINGKKAITYDTALELEKVLGIPAHIWVGMEAEYQLTKARLRDLSELEKQVDWLSQFPVKELEKRDWILRSKDPSLMVNAVLQFLGVASFTSWRQTPEATLFHITPGAKLSQGALACWLRRGELLARDVSTPEFDSEAFRRNLTRVRALTIEEPSVFEPELRRLCAEAGVVFVTVPELPKSAANGAARWLGGQKPLIQLSLRYKWSDVFWFSFFHESCHILRHRVKEIHLDGIDGGDPYEAEANQFAADELIEPALWQDFVKAGRFSRDSVVSFSQRLRIAPGIVVGRLQHERRVRFDSLNDLRTRFQWSES